MVSGNRVPDDPMHDRQWSVEIPIGDHACLVGDASRAVIISDRCITGLSADVLAELMVHGGSLSGVIGTRSGLGPAAEAHFGRGCEAPRRVRRPAPATLMQCRHWVMHDTMRWPDAGV